MKNYTILNDTKLLAVSEEMYNSLIRYFPFLTGYVISGEGNESNIAYINTDDVTDKSTLYDAIHNYEMAEEQTKMDNKLDELLNIVNRHRCKIEDIYREDAQAQIKRVRAKNSVWIELEKFAETYDKLLTEHNHAIPNAKRNAMDFLWDDVFYTDDERKKIDVIRKSTEVQIETFRENMDTVERLIKTADTFAERYQILKSYGIIDAPCKCEYQG